MKPEGRTVLRGVVFVCAGIDALAWLFLVFSALTVNSDAAGNGMAHGFAVAGTLVFATTGLPAFLLALASRYLPLALFLAAAPGVAGGVLMLLS